RDVGNGGNGASVKSAQDNNFTLTGSKAVGAVELSVRGLIDVCLEENARRLSGYDVRLLRPDFVPRLMRFARRLMWPPSANAAARGGASATVGRAGQKGLFVGNFWPSHCRLDPASLSWPDLDEAALGRLRGIPFWQEVLYTERRAGAIVAAYARTIADPLVREAAALQGVEEARHAALLRVMIDLYGVRAIDSP